MVDTLIALGTSLCTIYLAYLGISLSTNPLKKNDRQAQKVIKRKFLLVGAFSVAMTVFQSIRANEENEKHVDASVELISIVPSVSTNPPINFAHLTPGLPIHLNSGFRSRNNEALSVEMPTMIVIEDGDVTKAQSDDAWKRFWNQYDLDRPNRVAPVDIPIGHQSFTTASSQILSASDVEDLKYNSKHIYVLSYVTWKNPSGSDNHRTLCNMLIHLESGVIGDKSETMTCLTQSPRP